MIYFLIFIGLALGNVFSQLIRPTPNWEQAFDRCFFQAVALLVVWLVFGML